MPGLLLAPEGSLRSLFALLEAYCGGDERAADIAGKGSRRMFLRRASGGQGELFASPGSPQPAEDLFAEYAGALELPIAVEFYERSVYARDEFVYGWMSELPVERELIRFAGQVIAASRAGPYQAERDAFDREDPTVRTVLAAAHRVRHEIHRLMGFLRFSPGPGGRYIARCAPDHFTLPGLAGHFLQRFGGAPWLIVDERRSLRMFSTPCGEVRLLPLPEDQGEVPEADPWEALWRGYHQSISNERRANPALQRQFMPRRYWKYLPECR